MSSGWARRLLRRAPELLQRFASGGSGGSGGSGATGAGGGRRGEPAASLPGAPEPPHDAGDVTYYSVLDCGTGVIKALVVQATAGEMVVLAAATEAHPARAALEGPAPQGLANPVDEEYANALLAGAERALVAAEDTARIIPRRVAVSLSASQSVVSTGVVHVRRARPFVPLSREELEPALNQARWSAVAGATRRYVAEQGHECDLELVEDAVVETALDERQVADPAGLTGERLRVAVVATLAPAAEVRRLARLAEALDLELAGIVSEPFALGGALQHCADGPSVVIDVGAEATAVTVVGSRGTAAAAAFPVGGHALELRLGEQLGMRGGVARDAVAAHTVGAGARSGVGAVTARAVTRLAEHHADVWLDALELVCSDLARERTLPPRLLLCGGAAGLPELRRALAGRSWHASLPFERPPAVRLLSPADIPGVVDRSTSLPALQAVPPLCLVAVAGGAPLGRPLPLDQLAR